MPKPTQDETRKDFLNRCIPQVVDEGKSQDQAVAMCNSIWKQEKESSEEVSFKHRFSLKSVVEFKENEDDIVVKGYIATTHFDGQDIITKTTLDRWAKEINEGNPRSNKVSVNHNRIPHVAGVGVKGTAKVVQLPDGEFGLYVETKIDKTREDFEEIKYRIENEFLDSFSIEYVPPENEVFNEMKGARILGPDTELHGWTLASQPLNEHAVIVKEVLNGVHGGNKMPEDNKEDIEAKKENYDEKQEDVSGEKETEPDKYEDEEEEENKKKKDYSKEDTKMENVSQKEEEKLSKEDMELLAEAKEQKVREQKEKEFKEFRDKMFEEFKSELSNVKVENKTMNNTEDKEESKELVEFKEVMNKEAPTKREVKSSCIKLANSVGFESLLQKSVNNFTDVRQKEYKIGFKETKNGIHMEYKGLGLDTNVTSDADYYLSAAELRDVFDPIIYNTLNQKTALWNMLEKDDLSMKGNDHVQFTVKDSANTTAGAYTGNAVTTGNVGRQKLQTRFKKYQVGVEVDGDMIAAARGGPIGDVFAQEVEDSTVDLLSQINQDLFTEQVAETNAKVIGLPAITDASGNTTMYGLTRSSYGFMDGNSGATYINASSADISLSLLRQAIRQSVEDAGSEEDDLFFVCDYTQLHKFYGIYDAIQRTVPTSSRFGFEGRPEFDGVPIFADKDCKSGSWFLIDRRYGYRVGMWVPPTLEMLGKDSDSMKGFIKTYFATYSRNPNSVVEIYGAAIS